METKCPACGSVMIQKSRPRLLSTGACLVVAASAMFFLPAWWPAGLVVALTGLYLVVWATAGKARWCRTCKTFRIFP